MSALTAPEFATAYGLAPSAGGPSAPVPQFVPYVTGPAERWDAIAWAVYGDPTQIAPLIAANQTVAISPVLPQGVTLYCPLIAPPSAPASTLPWVP